MNKAIILGRLGGDPELKHTPSGAAVCNFSLATSESYTKKDGTRVDATEWHNIVVWGKLAELCSQYLSKGRQALIEGKIQTRSWDDKEGNKRYTTEVNASNVQFVSGQGAGENKKPTQEQKEYDVSTDANFASEEIPF